MFLLVLLAVSGFAYQIEAKIESCERVNINLCVRDYKKAVLDGKGHCDRLQVMINCLAADSSCVGEVITSFRVWMLQMGLMDKIMLKCKSLETGKMRGLLDATAKFNPGVVMDLVTSDPNEPCARQAHDNCVSHYAQDVKGNKKLDLCSAVHNLNQCYKRIIEKGQCTAAIIKDFAKILDDVASRVTAVLHDSSFPKVCKVVSHSEL